jgi:hypothetical protein
VSNIPTRIYRIAKAYLNQTRERIEKLDAELAEEELKTAADTPLSAAQADSGQTSSPTYDRNDTSAEGMMRRAEARIRAAGGQAAAREEMAEKKAPAASADPNLADYIVLGITPGADWSAVQSAYEKLSRRCDPRRFPDGSQEQKDAQSILERVNVAYEALRKRLDPTESRFGKLEF